MTPHEGHTPELSYVYPSLWSNLGTISECNTKPLAPDSSWTRMRLDIIRSNIEEQPLRWLLSGGSAQTLTYLEISYLQAELDTFKNISRIRAQGLLPKITHLPFSKSIRHAGAAKYYKKNTTIPLTVWNGIQTIYMYGADSKATNAIICGISTLSPIPRVEFGVGVMRMYEFKSMFRLGRGGFREGTRLRLVTARMGGGAGYVRWDGDAEIYWEEMEEEVVEVGLRYGVEIEVGGRALYEGKIL
ncbi:hypothetical protein E2P81_ATG07996 [Venturia nashicola]|nr:hypothetical protein E2P81_ATG07996 [Venturia nashicola]